MEQRNPQILSEQKDTQISQPLLNELEITGETTKEFEKQSQAISQEILKYDNQLRTYPMILFRFWIIAYALYPLVDKMIAVPFFSTTPLLADPMQWILNSFLLQPELQIFPVSLMLLDVFSC